MTLKQLFGCSFIRKIFEVPLLSERREDIRSMADLLRSGAKLTDLSCPVCSSPIFKLRNDELWCAKCKKKVVIVKEGEQDIEPAGQLLIGNLELTILAKIREVNERIREEGDVEQLLRLGEVLSVLLENLERARKIERRR
mgnify:CR=1 FL=1